MASDTDLRADSEAWLRADPDPDTRAELQTLIDAGDQAGLAERFGAALAFGTAGIRGPLGAGPARMNRAVVRRVSAGLAAVVAEQVDHAADRGVVVGGDARHKSQEFADDTARVLAGTGLAVHRLPGQVPTPLLAYAVRALGAAAGVQITASHNPPGDNGYKVYWDDGAQIVSPTDEHIAEAIEAVGPADSVTLADPDDERIHPVDDGVAAAYLDDCLGLLRLDQRDLRIVYTPLHGVAAPLLRTAFERAGFTDVHVVGQQAEPDPDFSTVSFPNPEMPGALDLALELARDVDADLVIANDPDGDRVAAAIPHDGDWRMLSGDELGCLLADHLLARGSEGSARVVATTVVSSQLLARIAEAHEVAYEETLTGFKWLARVAADAEREGRTFVMAYEQALGVMVGDKVRDKDGISASLVLAELVAHLKATGRDVRAALDDIALRCGVHATEGRSLRLEGEEGKRQVAAVLDRLRQQPPETVGGVGVVTVTDHAAGTRTAQDGKVERLETPPTDLIGFTLVDGSRVQVRPSGTEPLLKAYIEVVEPVSGDDVAGARERAGARLGPLADAFMTLIEP